MRRMVFALLALLLTVYLGLGVSAVTGISAMSGFATVNTDGGCQISLTVTLHLEQAMDKLYFPIPEEATGVTLNGSRVSASKSGDVRKVNLSRVVRNVVGDVTVNLQYSLYDVIVTTETGALEMQLPMLSGFDYPIDKLDFSVTLPGAVEVLPGFVSGYHEARIEEDLVYSVSGATITGNSVRALKDHETLTMTLAVTEQMFPRTLTHTHDYQWALTAIAVCAAVALLYWIVAMWNRPGLARTQPEPPHGYTAGSLGNILAGTGMDLTMMVLSWAQMGYLTMEIDRHNRVLLHKQMDMGNERSEFEVRCFKTLFGKRDRVDGGGTHFARLGRKAAKTIPGAWHYFRKSSGNPMIFRCIAAGIGAVAGYSLAVAFATDTVWQVLLAILLVPFGAVSSWLIQKGVRGVSLRHRLDLIIGVVCCFLWVILCNWSGEGAVAIFVIVSQILAGFAAIHGSRRTEAGLQARNEIFGLRKYLKSVTTNELRRIMEHNPDYYFAMVPYAMALGVDKTFARQFGEQPQAACPYLHLSGGGKLTARQWNDRLRQVVRILDDRQRKLIWEKLFGRK